MRKKYISCALMLMLITFYQLQAQSADKNLKITGMVVNQSNQPVKGAHLVADNKPLKSVSGPEGQFRIKVPATATNIGVSVTSEITIEEPINGRSEITIVIPDSIHELIKAQVELKADKTSNTDYAMYTNIYDLIRAKLPGVEVSGSSIRIRGAGSFTADSQPLFVVDGIDLSDISNISPKEVASIDILKGPDASIYGSRGANGVILIYLKKGKK
jgi:TonB-dependent SusC/RagA subfamily outer membrane receptor